MPPPIIVEDPDSVEERDVVSVLNGVVDRDGDPVGLAEFVLVLFPPMEAVGFEVKVRESEPLKYTVGVLSMEKVAREVAEMEGEAVLVEQGEEDHKEIKVVVGKATVRVPLRVRVWEVVTVMEVEDSAVKVGKTLTEP